MKRKLPGSVLLANRSNVVFSLIKRAWKLAVLLALVMTTFGSLVDAQAQRVEYVKGVLIPSSIKEGDRLKVGDTIATTAQGRIILAYSWATAEKDYRCQAYWIMNGGLRRRVPNLEKPPVTVGGTHSTNCGNTTAKAIKEALDEKATGINIIAFSGYPGKGGGDPNEIFGRSAAVKKPLDDAIYQGIAQLPKSFSGRIVSLNDAQLSIAGDGKETLLGEASSETEVQGGESLQSLIGAYVYIEYFTGNRNRIQRIMPTNKPEFYEFLGFHEEQSYAGNCSSLKQGQVCLTFDDGFVWLIDDQKPTLNQSQSRYGLTIQSAVAGASQYLHISRSRFVSKIAFHDEP